MSEGLTIRRKDRVLRVVPRPKGGFDLAASGGGNVTTDELQQIEAYVTGKAGADAFLADVRRRAAR